MPSNCAIFRSWNSGELLTASDLTTSFTTVGVTNMTPSCMDDYAVDTNQFRSNADPYPLSVVSLPTSLAGELERIRFIIKTMTGWSQWYAHTESVGSSAFVKKIGDTMSGSLKFSAAVDQITLSTLDGADNGILQLSGGGAAGQIRGAGINLYGNEHAGLGKMELFAGRGSGSGSPFEFYTDQGGGGALKLAIEASGNVRVVSGEITFLSASVLGPSIHFEAGSLLFRGGTSHFQWNNQANSLERMRLTDGGVLALGTSVTTTAAAGDLVIGPNNDGEIRFLNAAGTGTVSAMFLDASNRVVLGAEATAIYTTAIAGFGSAPNTRMFVDIGGTGVHAFTSAATGTSAWYYVTVRPASIAPTSGTGDGSLMHVGLGSLNPTGASNIGASLYLDSPNKGGVGTFTNMATAYISGAPTGGSNNYALFVDAGNVRLDGDLMIGTNPSTTGAVRLANNAFVKSRNAANSADVQVIGLDSSDRTLLGAGGVIDPNSDASSDLGESTLRFRDIFTSSSVRIGTNPAAAGAVRLANAVNISGRNAANGADVIIAQVDASDRVRIGPQSAGNIRMSGQTRCDIDSNDRLVLPVGTDKWAV